MTEQQACTLCGAGGHTAAQCKWGESLKLLRDLRQPLLDASMEYDEALSPLVGRIDSLLGRLLSSRSQECSQCGGSGYDCPNCIADFEREQAEGAQGDADDLASPMRERLLSMGVDEETAESIAAELAICLIPKLMQREAALAQPFPGPELERFAPVMRGATACMERVAVGGYVRTIDHINALKAVGAAPVAQAGKVPDEFSFEYLHPNGERHTVRVSREQVLEQMPDFIFEALCDKFCNCRPVGETNVVECSCDEYAEEFQLVAAAPAQGGE